MKKSALSIAALVLMSASSVSAFAQPQANPNGVSGSAPRPQGVSGSAPRPQSVTVEVYTAILAFFGF